MNLIEKIHSKWGVVKLQMELERNSEVCFYYPSGKFMGGLDRELGGALGYPSEEVNTFMQMYQAVPLNLDYEAYCELEKILESEIKRVYPNFLLERPVADRWEDRTCVCGHKGWCGRDSHRPEEYVCESCNGCLDNSFRCEQCND